MELQDRCGACGVSHFLNRLFDDARFVLTEGEEDHLFGLEDSVNTQCDGACRHLSYVAKQGFGIHA